MCQLSQSNLLFTSLYVQKLQSISHKLHPSSSSHGQVRELVFFSCTKALIFWNVTLDYLKNWQFELFYLLVEWQLCWCNRLIKCRWNTFFVTSPEWKCLFHESKNMFIKFQKQSFADVFQKISCWSYFLIKLQAWRSSILLKRDSNTGFFLWILFWRTSANGSFCTYNHKVSNKYWTSFLNQKHDMGWFLLRRFVDLVRLYSLLIISRNHSNTFLLLDLQKNRSKDKNISSNVMIFTGLVRLLSTT